MSDTQAHEPIADPADRFATARPQHKPPASSASPSTTRPYGLRFLNPLGRTDDVAPPAYTYDQSRQIAVGPDGQPLHLSDRMQRTTTGSSDGGSGPMEEWTYDR